jgi:hypothetical protein
MTAAEMNADGHGPLGLEQRVPPLVDGGRLLEEWRRIVRKAMPAAEQQLVAAEHRQVGAMTVQQGRDLGEETMLRAGVGNIVGRRKDSVE